MSRAMGSRMAGQAIGRIAHLRKLHLVQLATAREDERLAARQLHQMSPSSSGTVWVETRSWVFEVKCTGDPGRRNRSRRDLHQHVDLDFSQALDQQIGGIQVGDAQHDQRVADVADDLAGRSRLPRPAAMSARVWV